MTPPRILGIGGSPRSGGNSDILLSHILEGTGMARPETEAVHLRDYHFRPCSGCEKCRGSGACTGERDGMQLLYPGIEAARGMVLVSPTHHYNVTALMKAFIDRLYCFYDFDSTRRPRPWRSRLAGQGRKAVIGAVCEQRDRRDMGFTLEAMRMPLEALGYEVVGEVPVFMAFSRGEIRRFPEALADASRLGGVLAAALTGDG